MPPKKCPQCGLFNHGTALRCDCGYDFTSEQMKESHLTHGEQSGQKKKRALPRFVGGGIALVLISRLSDFLQGKNVGALNVEGIAELFGSTLGGALLGYLVWLFWFRKRKLARKPRSDVSNHSGTNGRNQYGVEDTTLGSNQPPPSSDQNADMPQSDGEESIPHDDTTQQIPETSKRAYFIRHWRGELSLPVSYWVNGSLVAVMFGVVQTVIPWDDFISKSPKMYATAAIATWVVIATTTVWQLVGTWRSADNYLRQGKSKLWGNIAKVALVLGFMRGVTNFVSIGVPQMMEYAKIAIGEDSLGTYQLRVLRDATELEMAGAIVFGLTDDIRRTLDVHPTIRVIHLNSQGGRLSEARNLRDLIAARGLTTFTASGCSSACTLAYAAGRERLIAKNASLGFHQYSFPGISGHEFQQEYEKDKQDLLVRGFARAFVDRAFTTSNKEMWTPTHHELFEANVVTGYPGSNDVAVSGLRLNDSNDLAEFLKIPLFAALKTYEPKIYDRLISELRTGLQKGKSLAELRHRVLPLVQEVYAQRLPYASDAALHGYTDLLLEQMKVLYAADPVLCYAYLDPQEHGTGLDVKKYFSEELLQKELSVMAEVIRSAAGQANQPPTEEQIESQLQHVFDGLAQRHGSDIQMLVNPELGKANMAKMCQLTYDLYQTILRLPTQESTPLLRFLLKETQGGER